ncbi:MAG: CoA transferase [bacterium]|jgi:crotonobetainyl-CoA:carnitine CoA-transferase CaiB-like acyl-CoA transferase|nr:CoA transferase [bacterium]
MTKAPLDGVRVLDLTHALAGPYCTMLLGDLGADVLKLEPPEGDQARAWGPPFLDGEASYFLSVNRNKRRLVLDLKSAEGLAAARQLALASDVVVENFRPGTAARLGLGAADLRRERPGLVYASISGYGQDWPALTGYDQIAQGTSGLMSMNGPAGGEPTKVAVPVGDITAGMFTAHAILASLVGRLAGGSDGSDGSDVSAGEGHVIDVSLNDSLLALLTYQGGRFFATGDPPGREGNHHPTIAPYGTFRTADGYLNVAVGSDAQFRRFCEALGSPALADDPRFGTNADRRAQRDALVGELERLLAPETTAVWRERLETAGVPAGPIHDVAQAFADPIARQRGARLEVDHPTAGRISQVAAPWRLDGEPFRVRRRPPLLGEHTKEVLQEVLGIEEAEAGTLAGDC